jgi:hypothetical protein
MDNFSRSVSSSAMTEAEALSRNKFFYPKHTSDAIAGPHSYNKDDKISPTGPSPMFNLLDQYCHNMAVAGCLASEVYGEVLREDLHLGPSGRGWPRSGQARELEERTAVELRKVRRRFEAHRLKSWGAARNYRFVPSCE